MKHLLFLLVFAGSLFAQTTSVPVTAVIQNNDIADIYTWVHQQINDPATPVVLTAAMDANDTTATVNSVVGLPASGGILIDSEMIPYTGISGNQITGLTRGGQQTTAAVHTSGTAVHSLLIATPAAFVKYCIGQQVKAIRQSLGASSVAVGAAVTAIQTNQAIVNALPVVN